MDAARGRVTLPVEALVVEEIDPMRAIVSTRRGVQVEAGYHTVESVPGDDVTGGLVFWVEIEPSHAPPFGVSAIAELTTAQVYGDVTITVMAYRVGPLRRRRGRFGEDKERRGEC
jgi:hypothetical protein